MNLNPHGAQDAEQDAAVLLSYAITAAHDLADLAVQDDRYDQLAALAAAYASQAGAYLPLPDVSPADMDGGIDHHDLIRQAALGSALQISDPRFVREAEFVGVRLGRALFSDGWTHRDGARRNPRAADDIVATRTDAAHLLAALHAVPAAGQVLAEHTPWIAAAAVEHGVFLSSDPAHNPRGSTSADRFQDGWTRWYPAMPQQTAAVTEAYNAARQASAAAQAATARAADAAGHPVDRAVLDADRRRTLGFTGDPARDARRLNTDAARARSTTTRRPPEPAPLPGHRAAELAREVGTRHPQRGRTR
ncbi:hypothetical protein [Streptomyces sp. FH025]|uniref:hypothetical protein n=1 Tax=Streptomyces sp. FH025 TaxID=2815937 RepID=UPI001A9F98D8|nr:hypothetical protein [Streptomyces sp. FH025]MBO1414185.1 hypothetical protein [Streptomyces sp. FH025]